MENLALRAFLLVFVISLAHGAHAATVFVEANVQCSNADGTADRPFCTIQAAIDFAAANGDEEIRIAPGVYVETLVLPAEMHLEGDEGEVVVEFPASSSADALVSAGNETQLRELVLRLPANLGRPVALLEIDAVEEVEIRNCAFDGALNSGSVGARIVRQTEETSRIRGCTFANLEVGIDAADSPIRVLRSLFTDILRDAIYIHPVDLSAKRGGEDDEGETEGLEESTPEIGNDDDAALAGINRFRNIGGFVDSFGNPIFENDSYILRNTTGHTVLAQLNDWGVYNETAIASRIGTTPPGSKQVLNSLVVFEPFIGKSVLPGSIYVRVLSGVTSLALHNANPSLRLGGSSLNIAPQFDLSSSFYIFNFLTPDTYGIHATAPAHAAADTEVLLLPNAIEALDLRLVHTGLSLLPPIVLGSTPVSPSIRPTPKLLGTAPALSVIQVYEDEIPVGSGQTTSTGTFEVEIEPRAPGVHLFVLQAKDLDGNLSAMSNPFQYEVIEVGIEGEAEGQPEGQTATEGEAEVEIGREGEGRETQEGEAGIENGKTGIGCSPTKYRTGTRSDLFLIGILVVVLFVHTGKRSARS